MMHQKQLHTWKKLWCVLCMYVSVELKKQNKMHAPKRIYNMEEHRKKYSIRRQDTWKCMQNLSSCSQQQMYTHTHTHRKIGRQNSYSWNESFFWCVVTSSPVTTQHTTTPANHILEVTKIFPFSRQVRMEMEQRKIYCLECAPQKDSIWELTCLCSQKCVHASLPSRFSRHLNVSKKVQCGTQGECRFGILSMRWSMLTCEHMDVHAYLVLEPCMLVAACGCIVVSSDVFLLRKRVKSLKLNVYTRAYHLFVLI